MNGLGLESMRRGLVNVTTHWQVIPLGFVQNVLVTGLTVLSLLPLPWALGLTGEGGLPSSWSDPGEVETWLTGTLIGLEDRIGEITLAIVVALVVGVVVVAVWGWFQGAILGVLSAGQQQLDCPGVEARSAGDEVRATARTSWSASLATQAGRRWMWPLFWMFHLFVTLSLVLALVFAVGVNLAVLGLIQWGAFVALGLTALGGLALAVGSIVLAAWFGLAQAVLVAKQQSGGEAAAESELLAERRAERVSVNRATRRSWALFRRAPLAAGSVVLVAAAFGAVGLVVSLGIGGLLSELFGSGSVGTFVNVAWSLVQSVPLSAISVFVSAALIALAQAVMDREMPLRSVE